MPTASAATCARPGGSPRALAADCLEFRAEAAVANAWLQRAHSLLDDLEPGPDHGWLAINEAAIRLGMDEDTVTARRLGSRAVELGRNSLSVRTPITSRR